MPDTAPELVPQTGAQLSLPTQPSDAFGAVLTGKSPT